MNERVLYRRQKAILGPRFELLFEPRDLWIGLYWDRDEIWRHWYVCLLPTLVLHWRRPARYRP